MPGWFVHMEAARAAAQRLRDDKAAPSLGFATADATALGELCHKWRNYLAIGSIGPDAFYLMPDYKPPLASVLLSVATWLLDEWQTFDDLFVGSWEKWQGPVGANDTDLTNQLTGGLNQQLSEAMDEISAAEVKLVMSLATRLNDWFGLLTSGPPQGLGDSAFYWSDMFHYRHTYDFPRVLWRMAGEAAAAAAQMEADLTANGRTPTADEQQQIDDAKADAEAETAFAFGWMTHCATDVTGHPFTNAKAGGPYRLHWQRHHLVENHMDGLVYEMGHSGDAVYEELGTSALHFRIAFRTRSDAPYNGRHDGPAYDYFAGFPAYPTDETAIDDEKRTRWFDMDPGTLPDHLVKLLLAAMKEVYGSDPTILMDAAGFNDPNVDANGTVTGPSGRPNADALNVMWNVVFRYLRLVSSDGLHPRKPQPPSFFTVAPFPSPPSSAMPPEDDGRGGDPGDNTNPQNQPFNIIDLLIALLALVEYLAQIVAWLSTVLPTLALDPATFPAREFLYNTVVVPLYSLYMATRKLLVEEGFALPKPEEIDGGLVTLGMQSGHAREVLSVDLQDPTGFAPTTSRFDEPSGRVSTADEWDADPAYPRQSVMDAVPQVNQVTGPLGLAPLGGDPKYSEWTSPWRYPNTNLAGARIGFEPHLSHVGPWDQGDQATQLFEQMETDLGAAARFEAATTPEETAAACHDLLPLDTHLGHPVDYSLYLVKNLGDGNVLPNFNLDSDRGYGFHCWDYDRHSPTVAPGADQDFHVAAPFGIGRFAMLQPCTVPEQYDHTWSAEDPPDPTPPAGPDHERFVVNRYRPRVPLQIHYLETNVDPCNDLASVFGFADADTTETAQAGMQPDGSGL